MIVRRLVLGLDALLVRLEHIEEFSHDADCLFRVSIGKARGDLALSDGTKVRRGEPVGLLHLWNEHVPPILKEGPDLPWALAFRRQAVISFRLLAAYVKDTPAFDAIQAFGGEIIFGSSYDLGHGRELARRWGFDVIVPGEPGSVLARFGEFWENLYALSLLWAFNPSSLRNGNPWKLRRDRLWMPRRVLLGKYGANGQGRGTVEEGPASQRLGAPIAADSPVVRGMPRSRRP
jgi:hypothetical protein